MSNQLTQNYNTAKIFVWDNRYQVEAIANSGYAAVTLEKGTVMARLTASGKLVPFIASALLDGSAAPIGVLTEEHTIEAGDEINVNICIAGDVVAPMLVFANGTDTLETVITYLNKNVKDALQSLSVAIKLVDSTELSNFDNQ